MNLTTAEKIRELEQFESAYLDVSQDLSCAINQFGTAGTIAAAFRSHNYQLQTHEIEQDDFMEAMDYAEQLSLKLVEMLGMELDTMRAKVERTRMQLFNERKLHSLQKSRIIKE